MFALVQYLMNWYRAKPIFYLMECAIRWQRLHSTKSMLRGLFQQPNQGGEPALHHVAVAGGWEFIEAPASPMLPTESCKS